jgi:hypothetical protein
VGEEFSLYRAVRNADLQAAPVGAPRQRPLSQDALIILLVAVLALAPELTIGLTVSDSYRFNILWPDQFGDLFRSGHWYPRWLPLSWNGFGSPNFYFYPPLFFWVTSAFDAISGGVLPPERFVPLGTLTFLILSGLTMHAWLKLHASERAALFGAIAYMLAPYHLYDIYARGALAETSAYALVPLVMLAIAWVGEGRTRYLPLLAFAYAALLMAHLPTALLVSLFLIPPYVAVLATRSPRPVVFLSRAALGGVVGIGLAAIYLIPALGLLPYVSPAALSGSFYRPENWFFWHVEAGVMAARMFLIVPVTLAAAAFAIGSIREGSRARETLLWAAISLLLAILIAGLVPPVWELPGLRLVQFPWRALLLIEFSVITMLAIHPPKLRSIETVAGALLAVFAYCVLLLMIDHTVARTLHGQARTAAEIRLHHLDAPEYLPAGTKIVQGAGPDDVSFELPTLAAASASAPAARVAASDESDGGMVVRVDSPTATTVMLHRFYFPHWRLLDSAGRAVPTAPDPRQKVVTFNAPAGRSTFRLELGTAPYETLAQMVSLIAALACGVMPCLTWTAGRRNRTANG